MSCSTRLRESRDQDVLLSFLRCGTQHGNANLHADQEVRPQPKTFAEFIVEDGDWLDITLISFRELLEHDAMYMSSTSNDNSTDFSNNKHVETAAPRLRVHQVSPSRNSPRRKQR